MDLILFRHGIAEDAGPGQTDAGRRLTAKGRMRLSESMHGLKGLVNPAFPLHILSSPLQRAAETAEILRKGLNAGPVQLHDCIADCDLDAFTSALTQIEPDACVIAVGHQPCLSEWSRLIAGSWLPFRKGAAAVIEIQSFNPLSGELVCFLQPRILRLR